MSLRSIISADAPVVSPDGTINLGFGTKYTLDRQDSPVPLLISGVVGVEIKSAAGATSSGVFRARSIAGESLAARREQPDVKILIALRDSVIVPIPREDLEDIFATDRRLRGALLEALSSDARRLEEAALIFRRRGVHDRLALAILGITGDEGGKIGLVHEDLSFFAGVNRATTTTQLGKFEGMGILTNDGTGYSVPEVGIKALRMMAICGDAPATAIRVARHKPIETPRNHTEWDKILT